MRVLGQRSPNMPRALACDALRLSRTGTYPRAKRYRRRPAPQVQPRQLSGEERDQIKALLNSEANQDRSVRVVHAHELNAGRILASVSTIYRVLRADRQVIERRAQRPAQRHRIPRVEAEQPNSAWTWDISKLPTTTPRVYLNLYRKRR
ncbi:hypothetical protein [Arhodomonas sp. AD133]|uniref:hypothetical protein n=1 Tax=Arhodomonas sp. AD133 TaxID=3415009 RepID=UPI003EC00AE6